MHCDDCGTPLWRAGDTVAPGLYARVDDGSYQQVKMDEDGLLPASFDGHIAWYRSAGHACHRSKTATTQREPRIATVGMVYTGR